MRTTVQRWGNSIAVRIPAAFARELGIEDQAAVDIAVRDGEFVVTPVAVEGDEFTLDELLEGMTEDNLHEEIDWGPPRGREVW
jgi:antitoxin MazE